jgi:hypothetical protein
MSKKGKMGLKISFLERPAKVVGVFVRLAVSNVFFCRNQFFDRRTYFTRS